MKRAATDVDAAMTIIRQACSDLLVVTGTIAALWHLAHGKPVSALCAALVVVVGRKL